MSPVVMIERYPDAPPTVSFYTKERFRDAKNRFSTKLSASEERDQAAVLAFVDTLLENFVRHPSARLVKQHSIPEEYTVAVRIGSRSDTLRPHRILFADENAETPALLVMADSSAHVGRGRGRTVYSCFLELLRGTGHRLGLLTNGQQFRLVYAGLDFESWCEWETDRWFDDGEGTEELLGLRQLLSPESLKPVKEGVSGLLDAVEESRKRQADLSSVLRENVRQAVELLLEEVSTANRLNAELFTLLIKHDGDRTLTDAEAHEALLQATVRVVMRLVVCLFAESRHMLPVNDPIYTQSYGVRTLYELLDEAARLEGGTHALFNQQSAWPRLMALFRLVHAGSSHGAFPLRSYGGVLFRPGDETSPDPVARALHILEHSVSVGDDKIYNVLRKLLRGPLPVLRGRAKTFVEGPVDYTDLRTEFIGLIYEGLLDYRLKRTDEEIGPQVFLNLGREPVLPLPRLTDMLANDRKGLKDLLTTLRKEKVTATAADEEEEAEEEADDSEQAEEESTEELSVETEETAQVKRTGDYLNAVEAATSWAKEAVILAGLVNKQTKRETDSEYRTRIEAEAKKLIKRVVATGEFYLVRAGNTRKGTGTFYTRPQLAVPTTHRTLQPLCYDKAKDATLTPKTPEEILGLKICDPACGSASFLVAALHYLTDALYKSLCHHRKLDDPAQSKKITLPFGRNRTNTEADQLVPFPPDDPHRGQIFEERVKALLRRHVVERCIYGVDINPLAVEFARVSLWVETLDPELPFSFLDHKIKVGNSLVGCWLDRVEDDPLKAWDREGGDGKNGERTQRIEKFLKGEKVGKRRTGDGQIRLEMRELIGSRFSTQIRMFPDDKTTAESVVTKARAEYEKLHDLPVSDPDERERYYREHIENSPTLRTLKGAMDEWCAIWFWPTDEESLKHVPTPLTFHKASEQKDVIVARIGEESRFFHWELEFPDVLTPSRSGFDGMVGNPPWDVMKPISQEFFTEFDPLYRTYDKQAAIRKQKDLLAAMPYAAESWDNYNARFKALGNWARNTAEPFDVALSRGKEGESFTSLWAEHRAEHHGYADARHPFRLQGSADLNSYKLFAEVFWRLLQNGGRVGVILPTGIYSDLGTKELRCELLDRGRIDLLYAFQNEKRIFSAAHHAMKQSVVIATRGGHSGQFKCRFRMGVGDSPEAQEIPQDLLQHDARSLVITPEDVRSNSPNSMSIIELTAERDVAIVRTVSQNSFRLGEGRPGWKIAYACEFHITNDSKQFAPLEKWVGNGFREDPFGRWSGSDGAVAVPFCEGRMIGQNDFSQKGWVSGKGRTAIWRTIPFDNKRIEPQYLMSLESLRSWPKANLGVKIAIMDITASTNSRSMIACAVTFFPFGHSAPVLTVENGDIAKSLCLAAVLNSFVFDFMARPRVGGVHFTWFILAECPLPCLPDVPDHTVSSIASRAARLTFLHRRFAPEWLYVKSLDPSLANREWKHWWAVTESDRLRLRVEIDALVANLYGLDPSDFDWIVRDDPKNSKGFYRVDRQLPFRERLTGLAATAFLALKEGKWSADSTSELSNDEFFDLIGIPELTNAAAAKAKGLSDPMIVKRGGCHVWSPESFPADDPRHGWTWNHCWQDAQAVLGSEDAVRKYIEGNTEIVVDTEPEHKGGKDLFGNPIPVKPRQKKMFRGA